MYQKGKAMRAERRMLEDRQDNEERERETS
jgi:hypothetical protein